MRWMLRVVFVSSIAALSLSADPSVATEFAALWYGIDEQEHVRALERADARLDWEVDLVQRRIAVKEEIIQDVLNGRMDLELAAARFAELNQGYAPALALVRKRYPGRTDEDRAARQLLSFLRHLRRPDADALADQWECRLRDRD